MMIQEQNIEDKIHPNAQSDYHDDNDDNDDKISFLGAKKLDQCSDSPPLPPPPPHLRSSFPRIVTPTPPSEKKTFCKTSSRAHLVNVRVQQKKAILVDGLPEKEFQTSKSIEDHFKRYGVITNCIKHPRGIINQKSKRRDTIGTVYIKFLNEKGATNAILATNGKTWDNHKGTRLHSYFVCNRYCDEFLQGRYCQDLSCILLHELMKDDTNSHRKSNVSMKSPRYYHEGSPIVKNYWKTPPFGQGNDYESRSCTILKKEWTGNDQKIDRKNIEYNVHGGYGGGNGSSSGYKKKKRDMTHMKRQIDTNHHHIHDSATFSPQMDVYTDGTNMTPLTQRQDKIQSSGTNNIKKQIDILNVSHSYNNTRERKRHQNDLPAARQLFKNTFIANTKKRVIAPPNTKTRKKVEGIDNPWAICSPIMIEKDSFEKMQEKTVQHDTNINKFHTRSMQGNGYCELHTNTSSNKRSHNYSQSSWCQFQHQYQPQHDTHRSNVLSSSFHGIDSPYVPTMSTIPCNAPPAYSYQNCYYNNYQQHLAPAARGGVYYNNVEASNWHEGLYHHQVNKVNPYYNNQQYLLPAHVGRY